MQLTMHEKVSYTVFLWQDKQLSSSTSFKSYIVLSSNVHITSGNFVILFFQYLFFKMMIDPTKFVLVLVTLKIV